MFVEIGPCHIDCDAAFTHHHDAVGNAHNLRQLTGDDNNCHALSRQFIEDFVNLGFGADIDTARRLINNKNFDTLF
ncbi:hypothetical protein D3C87_1978580 [compost metagenome]